MTAATSSARCRSTASHRGARGTARVPRGIGLSRIRSTASPRLCSRRVKLRYSASPRCCCCEPVLTSAAKRSTSASAGTVAATRAAPFAPLTTIATCEPRGHGCVARANHRDETHRHPGDGLGRANRRDEQLIGMRAQHHEGRLVALCRGAIEQPANSAPRKPPTAAAWRRARAHACRPAAPCPRRCAGHCFGPPTGWSGTSPLATASRNPKSAANTATPLASWAARKPISCSAERCAGTQLLRRTRLHVVRRCSPALRPASQSG